jgi:hypothetical protein
MQPQQNVPTSLRKVKWITDETPSLAVYCASDPAVTAENIKSLSLGTFAKLKSDYLLRHVCPSLCRRETTGPSLDTVEWNLIFKIFLKTVLHFSFSGLVTIRAEGAVRHFLPCLLVGTHLIIDMDMSYTRVLHIKSRTAYLTNDVTPFIGQPSRSQFQILPSGSLASLRT